MCWMWAGIALVSRTLEIGARFFREESVFTGILLDGTFYGWNDGQNMVCVHCVPMDP